VLSSTGLGFDPASNEHKVVRLFEDWNKQPRCEVYGLRSGGWRPCAGQVPPHAPKGLCSLPPVFVDRYFYWHMYWHMNTRLNFDDPEGNVYGMPEPTILSLSVDTEQFGWIHPPEERARYAFHLADLDGSLCAVVDTRFAMGQYDLWTLTAAAAGSTSSPWSLRCRISLAMTDALRAGFRMLPLGSSRVGEILLATSRHEVYAYDPESNRVHRAFSTNDFIDTLTCESRVETAPQHRHTRGMGHPRLPPSWGR
jgi:F-box interacting protein